MKTKIAILCSDDHHHKYLISILNNEFKIAFIVIESAKAQRSRLLEKRLYLDYFYNIYHFYRRKILGLDKYRKNYFLQDREFSYPKNIKIEHVKWINDDNVINLFHKMSPQITIVMGTRILNNKLLAAANGSLILNIHGGYLPYYKGNHCIFFALYNNEFDKIGSTIHIIDKGIDSGNIIEVITPSINPDDNAEKLYSKAEKMAIHRLIYWIKYYEDNNLLPSQKQKHIGKTYKTRDRKPHHDLIYFMRKKYYKYLKN